MSRGRLAMWFVTGVLVMIGLGIPAGKRLAVWRAERVHDATVAKLERGEASALRGGQKFPEIELVSPDGHHTTTTSLLRDTDALVVLLSPGCEGCTQALLKWNPSPVGNRTGRPSVIGIARATAEDASIYARETGLSFPVFADERDVFGTQYALHAMPTVIGTRADGTIAFIRHGISEDFTPEAAAKLLETPR